METTGVLMFTDNKIKNLKPRPYAYDEREGQGFAVRVTPKGAKSFCFLYTFEGKRKRLTLGNYPSYSLSEAREWASEKRKLIARGIDPLAGNKSKNTVSALIKSYLEGYAKKNKKSWQEDERTLLKDVDPDLGEMRIDEVTRADVTAILKTIIERGSERQATVTLCIIRRMFRYAVSEGYREDNPCLLIEPPSRSRVKSRVLSDMEIHAIWHKLGTSPMARTFQLILITAQRPGEVSHMQDSDIEARWWTIPGDRRKNGITHRVYLTDLALKHLITGCDFKKSSLPQFARRFCERHNMKPFTPHDLRRTAATHMGDIGIPDHIIGIVLGHKGQSVTRRHYNLSQYDNEKKDALIKWSNHLESILNNEKPMAKVIKIF